MTGDDDRREARTWYEGRMVPRREVDRLRSTGREDDGGGGDGDAIDQAAGSERSGTYAEIFRALSILTDGVFEVRSLGDRVASGYFDADHITDAAEKIEALDAAGTSRGIYVTLNPVNPALLSRRANRIETRLPRDASTTADADIMWRRWLAVDIDPKRPAGISSTDEEHEAALDVALKIAGFLTEVCGFPAPIRADSGNGAHLIYRIDLPNDDDSKTLVERCLTALAAAFNRPPVDDRPGWEIDPAVYNAARIWKIYGTMSRKGDNTPDRPHRRARILEVPETIEVVPRSALDYLAALAPEEEQPRQYDRPHRPGATGLDLDEWLREYGARLPSYQAKSKPGFRSFYVFDVCPWDPAHRDRSAFVGQLTSGPLVAGCHHNGCSGNRWPELRALVEPKRPTRAPVRREDRETAQHSTAAVQSSVSFPLIEGITIEFSAVPGGGWVTRFTRSGETLAEEKSDIEPWLDSRSTGRLTRALAAVTSLKETAIRTAINGVFEEIRDSPDSKAMMSEPAARVINATVAVDIELTDPISIVVTLDNDETMIFSSREIAALQPITINDRWLTVRRGRERLKATRRDFEQIVEYWFSIAKEVEPLGARSVWERIAEDLAVKIAPLPAKEDRDALLRYGIWQEPGGPLWVTSALIQEVIRDAGKNEYDPGFSRYLKKEGILIANSKLFRVGKNVWARAWGLNPAFKPDAEAVTFAPLDTDREERA